MFLHEDKELFKDVLVATSASQNDREIAIIEKDYYITMILRLLSQEAMDCVAVTDIEEDEDSEVDGDNN